MNSSDGDHGLRKYIATGPADATYGQLVAISVAVGLVFVFSATFPLATTGLDRDSPFAFLWEQLLRVAVGVIALFIVSHIKPRLFSGTPAWGLFGVGILSLLACRYGWFAHPVRGQYAWLEIGPLLFQPSEFVKVVYVMVLATIFSRSPQTDAERRRMWTHALLAMALICGALLIQKDEGMTVLVVAFTVVMLLLRGLNVLALAAVASPLVMPVGIIMMFDRFPGLREAFPHLSDKFIGAFSRIVEYMVFYDWVSLPGVEVDTFHMRQMLAALARGGLRGVGFGMSPDRWGALPTPHTDSIFCVIGGELGIVGAAGILFLIVAMALRSFRIGAAAENAYHWYLCAGLGSLIAIQSITNIAVATVTIPCTGITLPFISYGGSSLVACMIAAGIVLAVSRMAPDPGR